MMSYRHYSIIRCLLGSYLFYLFFFLWPVGHELFSSAGMIHEGASSPLIYYFPNPMLFLDHPYCISALFVLGLVGSVLLMTGYKERYTALGLWFLLTILGGRNPMSILPAMPYLGWLLLFIACLPKKENWHYPKEMYFAVWALLSIGYTYSGWVKLNTPAWFDGESLKIWLSSPFVVDNFFSSWLKGLSSSALEWVAQIYMYSELFFIPLVLWSKLRPFVWGVTLLIHVIFLNLIDVTDLMVGLFFMHLFAFLKESQGLESISLKTVEG